MKISFQPLKARPRCYPQSRKYEIVDLKTTCATFLRQTVRMENVPSLMAWPDLQTDDKVQKAALSFGAQCGNQLCQLSDRENLIKHRFTLTFFCQSAK